MWCQGVQGQTLWCEGHAVTVVHGEIKGVCVLRFCGACPAGTSTEIKIKHCLKFWGQTGVLCAHPFYEVVTINHAAILFTTDVRRPPAARCRKGPEQELMEFVLLLDELLKLVQIIRQIAENRGGINV